jgi:superfamily II DNA helicase RecQ
MKQQLHAGYILKTTKNLLENVEFQIGLDSLLQSLSVFEIEIRNDDENNENDDSLIAVLENLLSRGLPTFSSVFIEESITKSLNITKKRIHKKTGDLNFTLNDDLDDRYELLEPFIYNSLFIVDPRLKNVSEFQQNFDSWEEHFGSEYEELFYKLSLPEYFGNSVCQLIETQRTIDSILDFPVGIEKKYNQQLGPLKNDFYKQQVDFSVQFPETKDYKNGIVIEIDGSQHQVEQQKRLDEKRDSLIQKTGWYETVRINTNEVTNIPAEKINNLKDFFDNPYYDQIKENFNEPIWNYEDGLEGMQVALSPFGIARIQKTIIHLISQGILDLNTKVWKFGFIERDVPCADLAVRDLKQLFLNIFELESNNRKLPKIEYKIFTTEEFSNCQLNNEVETDSYANPAKNYTFDLLFDVSVLQRIGFSIIDKSFLEKIKTGNIITIRSSCSEKEPRLIKSSKPIAYKVEEKEQPKALVYFLQNIFRKEKFREGQVNILRRSLKQENVIALLPTGAGKSLTYQLSALLQPGIVLIVDPLKSLMKDQNDNLKIAGLDSTVFINSSIKTPIEREDKSEKMVKGFYQFVFISPERLQIPEFRDYLRQMTDTFFTYCVVDEAHCVSEWGHDFRTSYLRLGQNTREYCKTLSDNIPILGLTGTASFDVLADVQRELEINDESAIVAPAKYERKELNFEIIDVGVPEIPEGNYNIKGLVADHKQNALHKYLKELPPKNWGEDLEKEWGKSFKHESIDEFLSPELDYKNSGLIFCPHVGWKFGVLNIQSEIISKFEELKNTTGVYAGSLGDDDSIDLDEVQNNFKKNDLNLLVATKAFGMGIDKPNIRFTVHFNMPQSIESFYQEAGRAGRDKENAFCSILYSPTTITEQIEGEKTQITIDKSLMLSFYYNSFRGIEKEKRIMWELLNEISFPYKKGIDDLKELTADIDTPFKLNLKDNNGNPVLYVNGETFGESYGSIYLKRLMIYPEKKDNRKIVEPQESENILNAIKDKLIENCPANKNIFDWLSSKDKIKPKPGFEKILANMNIDDNSKMVVVGFTNDKTRIITDDLGQFDNSWEESMILKANNYCFTTSDFIQNLGLEYWKKTNNNFEFSDTQIVHISKLFPQIRDQSDTFKAIYRLSVIGVVDDYEVDYRTKTITATISKKKDEDHINFLKKYVGRYVSTEEKNKVPNQINEFRGDTAIQKCCGFLADFVYSKIAAKRFEAINVMESAIQSGLNNGDFEEFVNTYFDSKYTSDLRNYLYDYTIDLLWDYLIKTNGDPDSINHLRGACDRLLVENPDNPALLLMRAFSRLLMPQYNKLDAITDMRKGWKIFIDLKNWERTEYLEHFSKYYDIANEYDSMSAKYLDNEIVNDHLIWVKDFNSNFLKGIANA